MTTKTKNIFTLQPNPFQHEILELASKQRSNVKKEEVLRHYRNMALTSILVWNFEPNVRSAIPEGPVPYLDNEESDVPVPLGKNLTDMIESKVQKEGVAKSGYYGTQDFLEENVKTSLRNEYTRLPLFCIGGSPADMKQITKETIFINLLKGLHPKEAELLCLVKDKKLTTKYKISFENVKNAFEDLHWSI